MLGAMEERLPTEIWVKAHLRRCFAEAIHVAVLRKGDANGGAVPSHSGVVVSGEPGSRTFQGPYISVVRSRLSSCPPTASMATAPQRLFSKAM